MTEKSASEGLSKAERDAVRERAKELRAQEKAGRSREAGTAAVLEAIAALDEHDREIAEGFARIVGDVAPELVPKTYYGMPGFANAAGKIVVFLQPAAKFGARYATLGFEDRATLDDGDFWPTSFAVLAWTPSVEERVTAIVRAATAAKD